MELPPYQLNTTDANRAVTAMDKDARSYELVGDYLDHLWSDYRDSEVTQRILSPVRAQAQNAFRYNLDTAYANKSSEKLATQAFREMPALYTSKAFKTGVVLGSVASYSLLGKHTNALLLPHIDAVMPPTRQDHLAYIESLETAAMQSYSRTAAAGNDGGFLNFSVRVGEAVYDDQQTVFFKTGAALAYSAYHAYRLHANQEFSELVHDIPYES